MERFRAVLERRRLGLVPLKNSRVQVPGVGVEAYALICYQLSYVVRRLLFKALEAHNHIGHLDAGVVNVVLDFDLGASGGEQPREGIAQDGVSKVADVRRLVGIDAGVLDQDLSVESRFDLSVS